MAKIPFDIKFRPQIESGEYKLETECGHPVSIMDWEWIDRNEKKCLAVKVLMDEGFNIGYLFNYDGKRHSIFPSDSDSDLFIITPEPELSEFEEKVKQLIGHYPVATRENKGSLLYEVRKAAAELLSLAIDARAGELSEGLEQSKIDKDSIPYHLIEFMCNLYDCQNWKEIEDTAELYTTRVKAAALKDLPRWKKWGNGACGNGIGVPLAIVKRGRENYKLVDVLCFNGEKYIMLSDLEKLPGFKED